MLQTCLKVRVEKKKKLKDKYPVQEQTCVQLVKGELTNPV